MLQTLNNTTWVYKDEPSTEDILANDAIIQITGEIEIYSTGQFNSVYALGFGGIGDGWYPSVKINQDDDNFISIIIDAIKFGTVTISCSKITEGQFLNGFEKAYRRDRKYVITTKELVKLANTIRE